MKLNAISWTDITTKIVLAAISGVLMYFISGSFIDGFIGALALIGLLYGRITSD